MNADVLSRIQKDLEFIKNKVIVMDNELEDISSDLHKVRPEYIEKIKGLEKSGKFDAFSDINGLRDEIENV